LIQLITSVQHPQSNGLRHSNVEHNSTQFQNPQIHLIKWPIISAALITLIDTSENYSNWSQRCISCPPPCLAAPSLPLGLSGTVPRSPYSSTSGIPLLHDPDIFRPLPPEPRFCPAYGDQWAEQRRSVGAAAMEIDVPRRRQQECRRGPPQVTCSATSMPLAATPL
jgi:hypothetical protein